MQRIASIILSAAGAALLARALWFGLATRSSSRAVGRRPPLDRHFRELSVGAALLAVGVPLFPGSHPEGSQARRHTAARRRG